VERHSFSLKIKSVDDAGKFTGVGAVYNNVDLGGDKILPGAFTRTLAAAKQFPLLWQHNPESPIGAVKVTDTSLGLMVEGQLLLSDPTAAKAYQFLKAGIIKGLSIGYETIKAAFVDDVRELQELKLWELSVVTFPMNEGAMVTGIKAMSDDERSKHLKAIDMHRKTIDRAQRGMRESLKALFGDDLFNDDPADDPALFESNDDDDDPEGISMLVSELKALAEQAQQLASA
jgi:HK97 family phage prohead protease